MALCLGLPGSAGTRKVKPVWILLRQETVSGSGISWAICNSTPRSRQTTTPIQINLTIHYVTKKTTVIKRTMKPYHKVKESTYHQASEAAIQYYTITCSTFTHMQVCTLLQTASHHSSFFTGRMLFLPPSQQHQSSSNSSYLLVVVVDILIWYFAVVFVDANCLSRELIYIWLRLVRSIHIWRLVATCCWTYLVVGSFTWLPWQRPSHSCHSHDIS